MSARSIDEHAGLLRLILARMRVVRWQIRAPLWELQLVPRHVVIGAVGLGVPGAITGLVLGLLIYPQTAVFAIFEVGIPAALIGAILGLLSGLLADLHHRIRAVRGKDASPR